MSAHARFPHGDPSRVVREILAEPAYGTGLTTNPRAKPSLFALLWNWLLDHVLRPLFHPLERALLGAHGVAGAIDILLFVVTLAGFAALIFRAVLAFTRRLHEPVAGSTAPDSPAARSSLAWRAAARKAAERGAFGEAIAGLFAAALVALDESAVVAFDPARTPGEYRRLVRRARVAAAAPFDELAERFVHAAFAGSAPAAEDFQAAERAFSALQPALTR